MSALQCCELLAKSQVFQKQASTSAEESKNRAKKKSHGIDHAGGRIAFRLWTATSHPVEIKGGQNFGERQLALSLLPKALDRVRHMSGEVSHQSGENSTQTN